MKKLTMRDINEYIVSTLFQGKTETTPSVAARTLLLTEQYQGISISVLKILGIPTGKLDIAIRSQFLRYLHFNVVSHIVICNRPVTIIDVPSEGKLMHIDGFTGSIIHVSDNMEHQL